MTLVPNSLEIEDIKSVLSILIQQRYIWLFTHLSHAVMIDIVDKKIAYSLPEKYFFSETHQEKGNDPVIVHHILHLISSQCGQFAEDIDTGKKYDHNFVRELTNTGTRVSFLSSIQIYLEFYKIEKTFRRLKHPKERLFLFLRQVRNIVCHARGKMNDRKLKNCEWRGVKIEKGEEVLKISDEQLFLTVNDVIETLAEILVKNEKAIDFISLNLGYGVPFINELVKKIQ